jgi:HEAT repeat protein
VAFLLAFALTASAQSPAIMDSPAQKLVFDLLRVDLPQKIAQKEFVLPADSYVRPDSDRQEPPGASASLYTIAQYWSLQFAQDPGRLPPALRERIVEAAEAYPDWAPDLAHLFPKTPDANRRLLVLLDRAHNIGKGNPQEQITQHLSRNSDYFRPLLVQNAQSVSEGEGFVEHEEDLRAQARLDWNAVVPLLDRLAAMSQPRISALALALQYEHAAQLASPAAVPLRDRLMTTAVNRHLPARARDYAVDSLMKTEWSGRDDWFLSLFDDGTLAAPVDGNFILDTLESPVHREPEKWIPRIAPLVKSSNPSTRLNAIYVLVSFQQEETRADAELPLIPWLFNPKWVEAQDSGHDRHDLIYSLYLVPVPESASGLLHVIGAPGEDSVFEAQYAAEAIARIHDPRAGPALRRLLDYPLDRDQRIGVAKALLSTGTVTTEEKVRAVTNAAEILGSRSGLKLLDDAEFGSKGVQAQKILGIAVIQTEGAEPALLAALRSYRSQIRSTAPFVPDYGSVPCEKGRTRRRSCSLSLRRGTKQPRLQAGLCHDDGSRPARQCRV